jgi:cysteine desulfurase
MPGNISLSFKKANGETLLHRLDLMGICVSTGAACDNVNTQTSHVLNAIGLKQEYAQGTIRVSLGIHNNNTETDVIVSALCSVLNKN